METGPYQSLLPLAAAVWQGFQVRRRQALARHQAVMAFEPGDECCRQRSLLEQDDRVLIRKYKVWLVQPVEEGFAVSQKIGIAILGTLMIFVFYNDIARLVKRWLIS